MHIRPIVQAPKHSHSSSLAVAAGGLLLYAVAISGLWHPKFSNSGVTQVGREASMTFDDGTVLTLTEPESDLDILRRRRMGGWAGHEYRQIFIKSDGTEMEVINDRPRNSEDSDELDSDSHLMLTAYHKRGSKADASSDQGDGVVVADMSVDGKDKVVANETDGKDKVATDVIDGKDVSKDVVFTDSKDVLEQPVFALTTTSNPYTDGQGVLMALMGDAGSMWGDIRTASSTGLLSSGGGSGGSGGGTPGGPPIGTAVPEPSTWSLIGLAGVAALAVGIRRQRRMVVGG